MLHHIISQNTLQNCCHLYAEVNTLLRSTKYFISFIKTQKFSSNHQLVSFDVVSLFTNIPIDFTIDAIINVFTKTKKYRPISPKLKWKKSYCSVQKEFNLPFVEKHLHKQSDYGVTIATSIS